MTSDLKVKQESRGGRKEKIKKIRKVLKGRTHICHCLFYNKLFLHLLFIYYNLKYIYIVGLELVPDLFLNMPVTGVRNFVAY